MPKDEATSLRAVEAGRLPRGAATAWAQTNRGDPGINLTLQLGGDEVQLNIVGRTSRQASRIAKWLTVSPARAPDLELVVYARHAQPDHNAQPFWMHETNEELKRFTPPEVRAGAFAPWAQTWQATADARRTRLAYHLRRSWKSDQVLARGESLANEIAGLVSQAIPLLRDINARK